MLEVSIFPLRFFFKIVKLFRQSRGSVFYCISNLHIIPPQTLQRLHIDICVRFMITLLQTSYMIHIYVIVRVFIATNLALFSVSVTIDLVYTYILCYEMH